MSRKDKNRLRDWFKRVDPTKKLWIPKNPRLLPSDTLSYDGRTLTCLCECSFNIIHEVCHHLLASPERRALPNWGIGESPFEGDGTEYTPMTVSEDQADLEESHVNILGPAIAKLFGATRHQVAIESDTVRAPVPTKLLIRELRIQYPNALPKGIWKELERIHA